MEITMRPSGRRAGATWVASTGAFLLVAAAAVFVGVQWNRMTPGSRLAVVALVTGGCMLGGRSLRRALPATGDVLFHLGAFLLPIDLAAIGVQLGWDWRPLLLAEGLLGAAGLGALAGATGSVVLRWAAVASTPLLAAGVAAFTPVPAPVVLGGIALVAELAGRGRFGRAPLVWAATAGLAPVLGAVGGLVAAAVDAGAVYPTIVDRGLAGAGLGAGTLANLGMAGGSQVVGAPLAGVLGAFVLGRRALRGQDSTLALLAMASLAIGAATSALAANLHPRSVAVGLAGSFLVVEVLALVWRHDPVWARSLEWVANGAELAAGVVTALAVQAVFFGPYLRGAWELSPGADERAAGLSFAIGAVAWVAGDLRRYRGTPRPAGLAFLRGGGWDVGTAASAASAVVAAAVATGSGPAAAAALVLLSAVALAGGRPSAGLLAGVAGPWALLTSFDHPVAGSLIAWSGAGVAAVAAVGRSSEGDRANADVALAASAVATAALAVVVAGPLLSPAGATVVAGVALWLVACVLDRGRAALGDLARNALLVPVGAAVLLAPRHTVLGTAFVTLLLAADGVRLGRPSVCSRAAVAAQAVVVGVALSAGLSIAEAGLSLCVVAVGAAGLAGVVDERWRAPFLVATGAGLASGMLLASADPASLASAAMIAGGLLIAGGLGLDQPVLGHAGGALASLGLGGHLALAGVDASEPYLAPVALQVGIAGWQARRRRGIPSWAAYGPPIALLGGAALAERLAGGPGWHGLLAGVVGVMAVAVGGWRRLLGPLLGGTALLVAVTVSESLSALAGVPTWAWLGSAGAVLLGVGVALERADSTPVDAGRRLVDVLAERYS